MSYKQGYWLMFVLYCIMGFLQYKWREAYYMCNRNQNSILLINSKQADVIESQNDTIKVLKFKLHTLNK